MTRAAKTSTKEAVAKLAATARSTIRKLSPSSKSVASTKSAGSKKSTSTAPSTSSRSTARSTARSSKSTAATSTSNSTTSKAASKKPAAAAPPARKIARATGASKKTKTVTQAESKRANISKKRTLKNEDTDEEDEPKSKKTKTQIATKAKPMTAAAKLLATKAKMPLKKAAPKPASAKATINRKKRKVEEEEDEIAPATKKAKKEEAVAAPRKIAAAKKAAPKKTAAPKPVVDPITKIKILVQINFAPTNVLDVFVFGEGSAGELGLGARKINGKSPIDIKRPRKNVLLSAPGVGVVQLACGGMHGIALTKDNKVLTWGVNDQGALGRPTLWNDDMRVEAGYESDDSDDSGLNPRESTPTEIDMSGIAPNTKFVQVAASDNASFAVTEDGRVYGWGTFRVSQASSTSPPSIACTNHTHRTATASLASRPMFTSR